MNSQNLKFQVIIKTRILKQIKWSRAHFKEKKRSFYLSPSSHNLVKDWRRYLTYNLIGYPLEKNQPSRIPSTVADSLSFIANNQTKWLKWSLIWRIHLYSPSGFPLKSIKSIVIHSKQNLEMMGLMGSFPWLGADNLHCAHLLRTQLMSFQVIP